MYRDQVRKCTGISYGNVEGSGTEILRDRRLAEYISK